MSLAFHQSEKDWYQALGRHFKGFDYRDVRPHGEPISAKAKLEAKTPVSDFVNSDCNLYRSANDNRTDC